MHIPDGFLTPRVWVALDVVSASLVAVGIRRVSAAFEEKAIPLMGVLAAFVFAAQMINVPVAGGTSGHFLGGGLLGALLGPWAGLIVMSVVLMAQCFLFQDGGVAALGANIFNMGIIGAMGGALLYRTAMGGLRGTRRVFWAGFLAGSISMILSALGCAFQLGISRVISWSAGFSVIVGIHGMVGLMEGMVTGSLLQAVSRSRPDLLREHLSRFTLREGIAWLLLIVVLFGLAPFASELPDPLQKLLGTQ
jgi:cobalt/nickel transport system permease protein